MAKYYLKIIAPDGYSLNKTSLALEIHNLQLLLRFVVCTTPFVSASHVSSRQPIANANGKRKRRGRGQVTRQRPIDEQAEAERVTRRRPIGAVLLDEAVVTRADASQSCSNEGAET